VLASVVGSAALLTSPSSVSAAPAPVPGGDQTVVAPAEPLLDDPQNGVQAVTELGDDLDVAADRNDLGTAELRTLLRTDETAWVDTEGRVFFIDPAPDTSVTEEGPTPARAAPLADTFTLHSNPGASRTILLDVDGADVSGTAWNTESGVTPGAQPAWDPAADGPAFSAAERLKVQQVWAMVAEDYAPFGVDVTTEDVGADRILRSSSADTVYGTRVLVTPSDDAFATICQRSCGGVAYVNAFAQTGGALQPAWVFPQALGDQAKSVAEAASHEAGHNLSLQHDGLSTQDYYTGHGVWAPIMGVGYGKPLVQWSAGAYTGANNQQDDVAILTDRLGARPDEASGSVATPSPLPDGPRTIGTRSDVDAYLLGACTVGSTVTVSPAATAANLDVRAVLHDGAGVEQAVSQPTTTSGDGTSAGGLGATLTVPGAADGTVLTVDGVGQGAWTSAGYDDYGSLGAYTVSAPGCNGDVADGAPGEPVGVTPGAAGQASVTMSWSAPSTSTGGPVTGYVVTRSGSATSQTLGPDARSHTFSGLDAGTTYQLSVRAINAVGAGRTVTVSATTAPPPPSAPSAPRDVTASYDTGLKQIEAYWTEPASAGTQPITGYAVSFDGVGLGTLPATSRGAVITNASGFSPGQHTVGVAAVSSVGSSPRATATVTVGPVVRPANDDVANAQLLTGSAGSVDGDNASATKETTDPTPPSSSAAGGYSVWYAWTPTSNGPVQLATSGGGAARDTTLAVYTGQPGSLVRVAGNDDDGAGGLHAGVTFAARSGTRYLVAVDGFATTGGSGPFTLAWQQSAPKVPSAPTSVTATAGNQSALLSWVAADDNGSPVTGYEVEVSPGGARQSVVGGAGTATVAGLTNGTTYTFTVRATNEVGSGPASSPSNAVTPAGVPDRLSTPSAVRGDRSVRVSWSPTSGNGSPVTGYVVTSTPGGQTRSVDGATTSTTVSGLTNGTAYAFTVRATNALGTSPASVASDAATPAGLPSSPSKPTAVRGDTTATLAWTVPSGNGLPVTGYVVTTSPGGAETTVGAETSTTVGGLTNGTAYSFTVRAVNAVGASGASAASDEVTPAGRPDRPAKPAVARGDRAATVSWSASGGNGSPVSGYVVTASPGGTTTSVDGRSTTASVAGLANGVAHTFTVRAVNAVGSGPSSAASDAVTPAGVPDAPALQVVRGDTTARLTWTAPAANGAPVTGYTVRDADGTRVLSASGGTASMDVGALTNGRLYRFTVSASNDAGESVASAAVAVIPSGPPAASARPSAKAGKRQVTISWRPTSANGSVVTFYRVRRNDGVTRTVRGGARSYRWTGLRKGRKYSFTIVAVNQVGAGKASPASRKAKVR
jgi:hypothetical protein